jgi:hypothetical protein
MICQRCGHLLTANSFSGSCLYCGNTAQGEMQGGPIGSAIPWEVPQEETNPVAALGQAIKSSFLSPVKFFHTIARTPGIAPALLYALAMGSLGILAQMLWQTVLPNPFSFLFPDSDLSEKTVAGLNAASLILAPLMVTLKIVLSAGFLHGSLWITRSKLLNFRATFKTVCYAQGSLLLEIIPVVGPLADLVAWFYLILRGLSAAHSISKGRIVLALLIPLIAVVFLCLILGIIMAIMMVAISNGAQSGLFSQLLNK